MKLSGLIAIICLFFTSCAANPARTVCIKDACVVAQIADTDTKRTRGLMFRDGLSEGEGMLFVFALQEYYPFWMKNMRFPLDIIWIDEDKKVVDIWANAAPCVETCAAFTPRKKARYVLEVNAGFVLKNKIAIGDKAVFSVQGE